MKLYCTADGKVDPKYSALFNHIGLGIKEYFINFTDSISRKHGKKLAWWVSSPASRNIHASPLFHYCCSLCLIRDLILRREPIDEIITDSRAFKAILDQYFFDKNLNIPVTMHRLPVKARLKKIALPFYVLLGLPLKQCLLFLISKLVKSSDKFMLRESVVLIDTFVMPDYIEHDRYYPGMFDALSDSEKSRVWFVPQIFGVRWWRSFNIIKQIRRSGKNFLLKEDYLKLKDYFCLWRQFFDVRKLKIKDCFFYEADLSPLIREEITGFLNIASSYWPLLNFCFVKRLKNSGVRVHLAVDWFENQVIDKGWNAGFNKFYRHTDTIGFQGFIPVEFEWNVYPVLSEKDNNVLPCEIGVIGKALCSNINKYCPDIKSRVLPALRYKGVWRKRKYYPDKNYFTILLALPMMESEYNYILQLFLSISGKTAPENLFLVKFHPTVSASKIKSLLNKNMSRRFKLVTGDFNDCVERADLLVSNASSVCMETLAKGIPVIVVGNRHGLTQNPIPETVTEDIWRLCYTEDEIAEAIDFYKNRSAQKIKMHERIGMKIREDYFEPVTEKSVRKFLGFD